jgi:DNA gyrase/topoisomerase IV subunit A
MATNIPPHNLGEVIDACIALINDPALGIDDIINIVPGPDFPPAASSLAVKAFARPITSAAAPS